MSKGTKPRAIRVPAALWTAALAKAERTGESVTSVVVKRLEEWTAEDLTESGSNSVAAS